MNRQQQELKTIPANKIGFDFDGVIADTAEVFIRLACEEYGYCSFLKEDITSFDLEGCLDLPTSHIEKIFTDILLDSVTVGLRPMEGAVDTLSHICRNNTVTIITARPAQQPVFDWLELYFTPQNCQKIRVVATGDHNDKVRYIHEHGLKFFIDDRAETCLQLAREEITPIVFAQPWNKHRHTFHTVHDWSDIRNLISKEKSCDVHTAKKR